MENLVGSVLNKNTATALHNLGNTISGAFRYDCRGGVVTSRYQVYSPNFLTFADSFQRIDVHAVAPALHGNKLNTKHSGGGFNSRKSVIVHGNFVASVKQRRQDSGQRILTA
ncbi:hypothetical protein SDC9_81040 [bioreactor metagenome]|uniref:Uncharacterized protein n=1 Tax=bioreactor metagenome TaxID=1076179 RepID=A0A644Z1G3_9ZZZZ